MRPDHPCGNGRRRTRGGGAPLTTSTIRTSLALATSRSALMYIVLIRQFYVDTLFTIHQGYLGQT
jgi:hypothetical protein